MKHYLPALLCILALTVASCDSNEQPVNPPQYRISWIYSEDAYHVFEYDAAGRISEWKYNETGTDFACSSTYSYPDGDRVIDISADERSDNRTWHFDERLYLASDGTADRAEGNATMSGPDGVLMKKAYNVTFSYNASRRLTDADISERIVGGIVGDAPEEMKWDARLQWSGSDLISYSEYSDSEKPLLTREFTYFGGETAHYLPIVQGAVVRRYYLALQYQGVLGRQPDRMVKSMTASAGQDRQTTSFSYDIAASVYYSMVEGYTTSCDGRELSHTVSWENKKTR